MSNDNLISIQKQSVHAYCSNFTNIINKSLKNKTFLDILRNTDITPCHKKDNKESKKNIDLSAHSQLFQSGFKQYTSTA